MKAAKHMLALTQALSNIVLLVVALVLPQVAGDTCEETRNRYGVDMGICGIRAPAKARLCSIKESVDSMAARMFTSRDNSTEANGSRGLVGLDIPRSDSHCRDSYSVICGNRSCHH